MLFHSHDEILAKDLCDPPASGLRNEPLEEVDLKGREFGPVPDALKVPEQLIEHDKVNKPTSALPIESKGGHEPRQKLLEEGGTASLPLPVQLL